MGSCSGGFRGTRWEEVGDEDVGDEDGEDVDGNDIGPRLVKAAPPREIQTSNAVN